MKQANLKHSKLTKALVLTLLLSGGTFSRAEALVADDPNYVQNNWPSAIGEQQSVAIGGATNTILVTSGEHSGYTKDHGTGASILAKGGAGMQFDKDTIVHVEGDSSTAAHRLLQITYGGSTKTGAGTGNYSGTIYLEEKGQALGATPVAKFEAGATANFLEHSQTTIINNIAKAGYDGMGVNNATLNLTGDAKLNITTKGGAGLVVDTLSTFKSAATLADTAKLVIDAQGNGLQFVTDQRLDANANITFTTGADTVLDVTSHATGTGAALYARENTVFKTEGIVILKNDATNGNAILSNPYANDVANNITIDGLANNKLVQITGNILYNVVNVGSLTASDRTQTDKITILMGDNNTTDPSYAGKTSFFEGNHDLGFRGETALTFAGNSYWKGNNYLHSISDNGSLTALFKDTASWTGDNKVTQGTAQIEFEGTTAANTWTGNNTVSGGTNTVQLSGLSSWIDADGDATNTVSGGSNIITLNGTGEENKWEGNSLVSGGTNTVNLSGVKSTWKGNSTVSNAAANAVNISQGSQMLGDTTVSDQADNKFNLIEHGYVEGSTTLNNNATNTTDMKDDSRLNGSVAVNDAAANILKLQGTAEIYGGTISTNNATAQNTMTVQGGAKIKDALINNAGQMLGTFTESGSLAADNTTVEGTTNLTFSGTSTMEGNNKLSGNGTNTLTFEGTTGNTWTGTNSVTGNGVNNINLTGSSSAWITAGGTADDVLSSVEAGTNNLKLSNTSTATGTQNISGGQNNISMLHSAHITGSINVTNTGNNQLDITDTAVLEGGKLTTTGASAISVINASGTGSKVNNDLINAGGSMTGTFINGSSLNATNSISAGRTELSFSDTAQFNGDSAVLGGTMLNTLQGNAVMTGSTAVAAGNSTVNVYNDASVVGTLAVTGGTSKVQVQDKGAWIGDVDVQNGTNAMQLSDKATLQGNQMVHDGTATLALANEAAWTGDSVTFGGTNTVTMGDTTKWTGGTNTTTGGTMTLTASAGSEVTLDNVINGAGAVFTGSFADTVAFTGDNTITAGKGTLSFTDKTTWQGQNRVDGGDLEIIASDEAVVTGATLVSGGTNTATFNDKAVLNGATTVSGGVNSVTATADAALNGNITVSNAGQNTFALAGKATLTGDLTVQDAGVSSVSLADDTLWLGNSAASSTSTNSIALAGASKWEGSAKDVDSAKTSVALADNATWFVMGDGNINGLNVAPGTTVDMTNNWHGTPMSLFNTLTVDTLSGTGTTFKLETDLEKAVYGSETTDGDKLVINGTSSGTHYVQVLDQSLYTGAEITGDRKLLLITDESGGNYKFEGKALNLGGLWNVNPPTFFQEGNKWYLGYIQKEANSDTTVTVLDRHTVYNQWTRINNDSLRKRLGDLRYSNGKDGGVWARTYHGRLEGAGYKQSYNTLQVGVDKTNGHTTYGLAIDKQGTSQSYQYGNGKGENTNGSLYVARYTDSGSYWDIIGKLGKINSTYRTTGDYPDHADYNTKGYSLSAEYGKTNSLAKGYFVEPKVQLTYGYLSGNSYTTDRKTLVREAGIRSLMSRVGLVAGRKLANASDYYLKANWFKEFKADRYVHMTAANGENMKISEEMADSWFEIGVGGNIRVANKTHLYGDIERSFGADVDKTWQINAGIRWEF